jgi:predicted kinase
MQHAPSVAVVIVTGLPGTGKTVLAERLAARFGFLVLEKDLIKETAWDTFARSESGGNMPASRVLSDLSFALLFALARRLAQPGRRLLLEGNFRPGEHEPALHALAAGAVAVRFAQILCQCDETLRRARLGARAGAADRHPAHEDAQGRVAADTRSGAGLLDLPGERLDYDSGAAEPVRAFEALCEALGRWLDSYGGS